MGTDSRVPPSRVPPARGPARGQPQVNAEGQRRQLIELLAAPYERLTAYVNSVAIVGYASFFAIWAFTRDLMSPRLNRAAALLMLISCSVFVFWEVWQMYMNARQVDKIAGALQRAAKPGTGPIEELARIAPDKALLRARLWALQVYISAGTAVVAVALMAWSLGISLLQDLLRSAA